MKSQGVLAFLVVAMAVCAIASKTAEADSCAPSLPCLGYPDYCMPRIWIDAGHGGGDTGAYNATYELAEKTVNLAVAIELEKDLEDLCARVFATRCNDAAIDVEDRPPLINSANVLVSISVHHNSPGQADYTRAYVCDQSSQWGMYAYNIATFANDVSTSISAIFGTTDHGCYDDCSTNSEGCPPPSPTRCHLDLVEMVDAISIIGEAWFISNDTRAQAYLNSNGAYAVSEAAGYLEPIKILLGIPCVPVVPNSFTATGGTGRVTLTWEVTGGSSNETYQLRRRIPCRGPSTFLGTVAANDPVYTNDGVHYAYVDSTVAYGSEYFYSLYELPAHLWHYASDAPLGLPAASMPPAPTLSGYSSQDAIHLLWTAEVGATGYRVFRDLAEMSNCEGGLVIVDTTGTSFIDEDVISGATYYYRVQSYNADFVSEDTSNELPLTNQATVVGVENLPSVPSPVWAAPNPFATTTALHYEHSERVHVSVVIYSISGRRVRALRAGDEPPGAYSVSWDGRDDAGREVPTGVYIFRVILGEKSSVGKALLLK